MSTYSILGSAQTLDSGSSVSSCALSGDGCIMAHGHRSSANGGTNRGSVTVYAWNGTSWSALTMGSVSLSDNDYFGTSVALSTDGEVLAVGATGAGAAGTVYVFAYDGTQYELREQITQSGSSAFGITVALNGDGTVLAVGDQDFNSGQGRVTAYAYASETYSLRGSIDDMEGVGGSDQAGAPVHISNDGAVISTTDAGSKFMAWDWNGSAWVARSGGTWVGTYGSDLAMNADGTVFAGYDGVGLAIRIYTWGRSDTDPPTVQSTLSSVTASSLAMSADGYSLVVGLTTTAGNAGRLSFYGVTSDNPSWAATETAITHSEAGDRWGSSVAMSHDGVIVAGSTNSSSNPPFVSAYTNNTSATSSGIRMALVSYTSEETTDLQTLPRYMFASDGGEGGPPVNSYRFAVQTSNTDVTYVFSSRKLGSTSSVVPAFVFSFNDQSTFTGYTPADGNLDDRGIITMITNSGDLAVTDRIDGAPANINSNWYFAEMAFQEASGDGTQFTIAELEGPPIQATGMTVLSNSQSWNIVPPTEIDGRSALGITVDIQSGTYFKMFIPDSLQTWLGVPDGAATAFVNSSGVEQTTVTVEMGINGSDTTGDLGTLAGRGLRSRSDPFSLFQSRASETYMATSTVPCFVGTTPIPTPTGFVPIRDLKPGDQIVDVYRHVHTVVEIPTSITTKLVNINGTLVTPNHLVSTPAGRKFADQVGREVVLEDAVAVYHLCLQDWTFIEISGVKFETCAWLPHHHTIRTSYSRAKQAEQLGILVRV